MTRIPGLTTFLASSVRRLTRATSVCSQRKLLVTRDLGPDTMSLLYAREDLEVVTWPEDRDCERSWLLDNVPGAAGAIVMVTEKIDEEVLERGESRLYMRPSWQLSTSTTIYSGPLILKSYQRPLLASVRRSPLFFDTVQYMRSIEHVDLQGLYRRKIRLGYTPDVLNNAVADVAVMLALMAGRLADQGVTLVKEGKWPAHNFGPFHFVGPQLSPVPSISTTRTVGFLGFGRIAQATLARLAAFGVTHCIYSTNPSSPHDRERDAALAEQLKLRAVARVDLDTLARDSDVLILLAPGGAATRHVIDEAFLRKMGSRAVLVNVARGTLVDSDALAKALREGWIWGAAVDVVEGEPQVGADHPLVREPRCVVVPHIGSATFETRLGMVRTAATNALAGLDEVDMPAELDVAARLARLTPRV
ncbi:hypothetical protein F5148DRAFT_1326706 [Russula earlei]|uniref:Uncharacterized protein n=1 Tax=Russula earlei TaxID=71964 RepID=A0ACC0U0U8_9AGAM|nr:hypothetical protein F5148DRAFT_1326706 [Russula earlei]